MTGSELHNLNIFSEENIGDAISTALEVGSNYWIDHVVIPRDNWLEDIKYYDIPMKGGAIIITEHDGDGTERVLNKESIAEGLEILRIKYPWHFKILIMEAYDAAAADAFLQCAVLGDIVYG